MSMSSHVIGFRPPNAEYNKMAAAYKACLEAGVKPPEDVLAYFDDQGPDPAGTEVNISKAVTQYNDEMRDGFEVDITKLPKGVKTIRFFNSY